MELFLLLFIVLSSACLYLVLLRFSSTLVNELLVLLYYVYASHIIRGPVKDPVSTER
jgi:hypothetical protein